MAASMQRLLTACGSTLSADAFARVVSLSYIQTRYINKHYHPEFRRQRGLKKLKVNLPNFENVRRMLKQEFTPAEIRAYMRQKGLIPYAPDAPIVSLADSGQLLDKYVPKEGDGHSSSISSVATSVGKKGVKWKKLRDIRKLDPDFDIDEFPQVAHQLYADMHHQLMKAFPSSPNKDNEDEEWELRKLVTEFAWPLVTDGLKNKTLVWRFVESLEPPRVVNVACQESKRVDNKYGQITVRFHSQQIMALYDRFGRLICGSQSVPKDVLEYVVFEKHLSDTYGTWRIHGKIVPEWKPPTHEFHKTVVIPKTAAEVKPESVESKEGPVQPLQADVMSAEPVTLV